MNLYFYQYILIVTSFLICIPNGFSASQEPLPPAQETNLLRVGTLASWNAVHPFSANDNHNSFLKRLFHQPLVRHETDGSYLCNLCETIPQQHSNEFEWQGKGARRLIKTTWRLHKDLRWSDGTPLTNADVVFSFEVAAGLRQTSNGNHLNFVDGIESIVADKSDPRRFYIYFFGNNTAYFMLDQFFLLPRHLDEDAWNTANETGADYMNVSTYRAHPYNKGLYTGAYRIEAIGDRISLVGNSYAPLGKARLKRAQVLHFSNMPELCDGLIKNNVDIIPALERMRPQDFECIQRLKQKASGLKFLERTSNSLLFLAFNLRNPTLLDAKKRRALAAWFDVDDFEWGGLDGKFEIATGLLPATDPLRQLRHETAPVRFRRVAPPKALNLFANRDSNPSSLQANTSSTKKSSTEPMNFELLIPEGDPLRSFVADKIATQMNQKNQIKLNVKKLDDATFKNRVIAKADYRDLALFTVDMEPYVGLMTLLHSSRSPSFNNDYRGRNIFAWRSARADGLLDRIYADFDMKTRSKSLQQLLSLFDEETPMVPLLWGQSTLAFQTRLSGVIHGLEPPTAQVQDWIMK